MLRNLLMGNHSAREQAILAQPPEMQPKIRKFIKAKRENENLVQIMLSDLSRASKLVKDNPDDQFLRRMTIRCFAATVEGILYGLKILGKASGEICGYQFTDAEMFLLTEKQDKQKKLRRLVFRENMIETFKLFAKVNGGCCLTDFDQSGFQSLCKTFDLRNRLMHPKSPMTFYVSDVEKQKCAEASAWLDNELNRLLGACGKKM